MRPSVGHMTSAADAAGTSPSLALVRPSGASGPAPGDPQSIGASPVLLAACSALASANSGGMASPHSHGSAGSDAGEEPADDHAASVDEHISSLIDDLFSASAPTDPYPSCLQITRWGSRLYHVELGRIRDDAEQLQRLSVEACQCIKPSDKAIIMPFLTYEYQPPSDSEYDGTLTLRSCVVSRSGTKAQEHASLGTKLQKVNWNDLGLPTPMLAPAADRRADELQAQAAAQRPMYPEEELQVITRLLIQITGWIREGGSRLPHVTDAPAYAAVLGMQSEEELWSFAQALQPAWAALRHRLKSKVASMDQSIPIGTLLEMRSAVQLLGYFERYAAQVLAAVGAGAGRAEWAQRQAAEYAAQRTQLQTELGEVWLSAHAAFERFLTGRWAPLVQGGSAGVAKLAVVMAYCSEDHLWAFLRSEPGQALLRGDEASSSSSASGARLVHVTFALRPSLTDAGKQPIGARCVYPMCANCQGHAHAGLPAIWRAAGVELDEPLTETHLPISYRRSQSRLVDTMHGELVVHTQGSRIWTRLSGGAAPFPVQPTEPAHRSRRVAFTYEQRLVLASASFGVCAGEQDEFSGECVVFVKVPLYVFALRHLKVKTEEELQAIRDQQLGAAHSDASGGAPAAAAPDLPR